MASLTQLQCASLVLSPNTAELASQESGKQVDLGFPGGSVIKNLPANAGDRGDMGSIPSSG